LQRGKQIFVYPSYLGNYLIYPLKSRKNQHDVRIPEGGKISGHVTITEGSNIKLSPRN
jgi:hypothetical protein